MSHFVHCLPGVAVCALLLGSAGAAVALEAVGSAATVADTVRRESEKIVLGSAIFGGDRISSDADGLAQFKLLDGTKLVVGPNSSLLIDEFVYATDRSTATIVVSALKGVLRWISGAGKPARHTLKTALGSLAIRGTAFDLYALPDQSMAIVLYQGIVDFCTPDGACRTIDRRCDVLVVDPVVALEDPRRMSRRLMRKTYGDTVFPFFEDRDLLRPFRVEGSTCTLRKVKKAERRSVQRIRPQAIVKSAKKMAAVVRPKIVRTARLDRSLRTTVTLKAKNTSPAAGSPPASGSGLGNPGNDKAVGSAGESPGNGGFGAGTRGKSDVNGHGGKNG